jgi:hypothetical protein
MPDMQSRRVIYPGSDQVAGNPARVFALSPKKGPRKGFFQARRLSFLTSPALKGEVSRKDF